MNQESNKKKEPFSLRMKYKFIIFLDILRTKILRRKSKINETIVIFGTPRSGTTWIMEVINEIRKGVFLFEPLNKKWFPIIHDYYEPPRPLLLKDNSNDAIREFFHNFLTDAFQGKIYSKQPFLRRDFKTIKQRIFSNKLIVKFVRGNRMIPWIQDNFDLKKIILIIRNPLTTIASQLKRGITGYFGRLDSHKIETVKKQTKELDFLPDDIKQQIENFEKEEEILAVMWALDYYIPLKFCDLEDLHLIIYENFMIDKEKALNELYRQLNLKETENPIDREFLDKPSMLGVKTYTNDQEKQLNKWQEILSEDQVENILHVLEIFGMDFYNKNPVINKEKFENFIKVLRE